MKNQGFVHAQNLSEFETVAEYELLACVGFSQTFEGTQDSRMTRVNVYPDYNDLDAKLSISSADDLKTKILEKCYQLNLDEMANDVSPILFENSDTKKVERFIDLIQQYSF